MHDGGFLNEESMKPEIVHAYNMTKGGTDTIDQLYPNYSVSRTRRWLCVHFLTLTISGIYTQILYSSILNESVSVEKHLQALSS